MDEIQGKNGLESCCLTVESGESVSLSLLFLQSILGDPLSALFGDREDRHLRIYTEGCRGYASVNHEKAIRIVCLAM